MDQDQKKEKWREELGEVDARDLRKRADKEMESYEYLRERRVVA